MSRFDDGDFTFNVKVSLDAYEEIWGLFDAAVAQFTPANLRALGRRWQEVAKPELDGKPVEVGELDPNLLLALVKDWVAGVRDVPLPLPLRSSDGEPSADQSPANSPTTSSGTASSDDGPDTPLRA